MRNVKVDRNPTFDGGNAPDMLHNHYVLFQLIQRIIQCINMSGYSYYYEKLFVAGKFNDVYHVGAC